MSKFTAAGLVVFYQKVADGGVMEVVDPRGSWYPCASGPTLMQNNREWRIKPAKKIIDLEPLIASGIDCEFWSIDGKPHKFISRHNQIGRSPVNSPQYSGGDYNFPWDKCRPRMNHKMFYVGLTPIAGFVVRIYFNSVDFTVVNTSDNTIYWAGVKAIEYLRVEDGYAYPWEKSE